MPWILVDMQSFKNKLTSVGKLKVQQLPVLRLGSGYQRLQDLQHPPAEGALVEVWVAMEDVAHGAVAEVEVGVREDARLQL